MTDELVRWINFTLSEFQIDKSLNRTAHFIAQIAHESGQFQFFRELASGVAYDTGRLAKRLGNTPDADGDGQRYKGRGAIQITGRFNYQKVSDYFKVDFIKNPEKLESPEFAIRSAGYYWDSKKLNVYADKDDILSITKIINGGTNGYAERKKYLDICKNKLAEHFKK